MAAREKSGRLRCCCCCVGAGGGDSGPAAAREAKARSARRAAAGACGGGSGGDSSGCGAVAPAPHAPADAAAAAPRAVAPHAVARRAAARRSDGSAAHAGGGGGGAMAHRPRAAGAAPRRAHCTPPATRGCSTAGSMVMQDGALRWSGATRTPSSPPPSFFAFFAHATPLLLLPACLRVGGRAGAAWARRGVGAMAAMDEASTLRWLREALAERNARESGAFRDVFAAHADALRRARALEQRNASLSRRVARAAAAGDEGVALDRP
jgi:hypothetical protein